MEILKNSHEYKPFLKLLGKIIIILIIIQILRAFVMDILWYVVKPGENIILFQILNGISFLIGLLLLGIFRPSLRDLSLNLDDVNKKTKIIYLTGLIALPIFIFLPIILGSEFDVLIISMIFGIVVPAFEELLFR